MLYTTGPLGIGAIAEYRPFFGVPQVVTPDPFSFYNIRPNGVSDTVPPFDSITSTYIDSEFGVDFTGQSTVSVSDRSITFSSRDPLDLTGIYPGNINFFGLIRDELIISNPLAMPDTETQVTFRFDYERLFNGEPASGRRQPVLARSISIQSDDIETVLIDGYSPPNAPRAPGISTPGYYQLEYENGLSFNRSFRPDLAQNGDGDFVRYDEYEFIFSGDSVEIDFIFDMAAQIDEYENIDLIGSLSILSDSPINVDSSIGLFGPPDFSLPESLIIFTHGWAEADNVDNPGYLGGLATLAEQRLARNGITSEVINDLGEADLSQDALIFEYEWPEAATQSGVLTEIATQLTGISELYRRSFVATEDAGDRLGLQVLDFVNDIRSSIDENYAPNIHFIGHSLGTMVNTYAIEQIFNSEPSISVEQMTILDDPLGIGYNDPTRFPLSITLARLERAGLREIDFFENHLEPGSVTYVENFFADEITVFDEDRPPAFGGPVPGAGPGNEGGQEVNANHESIWQDFYADLIDSGDWITPALDNWDPPNQWPGEYVEPTETIVDTILDRIPRGPTALGFDIGEIIANRASDFFENIITPDQILPL